MIKGLGTALITPFDANGKVDYEALARLLDTQLTGFVDYLVVLGTTGEAATLTTEEKKEVRQFIVHYVHTHPVPSLEGRPGGVSKPVSIMSGNNFRGTWYIPSGKNYLAYLFKDAGAAYPFYDNDRETSIPLTVEDCLHYFGDADVWVGAGGNSMAELAQMDEKHTWFKAYQNGRVYNWRKQQLPGGANNFWERGVVHPEEMLEDVIHILNNAPDSMLHFANSLY